MGELVLRGAAVCYRYPRAERDAVQHADVDVGPGELVGIVGPNGCGKTTLIRLLVGARRPTAGKVEVLGKPLQSWDRRDLARTVAVVTQREAPAFPLTVEHTVALGRYPHVGALGVAGPHDRDVVTRALERCDIASLSERWVETLSGGEWQRVRIARALAQEPRLLVLDEATANLDVRHEMEVFELVGELVRDGLAGLIVTHHVNMAARFVDRLIIMSDGAVRASGPPNEVLTRDVVEEVFEWPVEIEDRRGIPQVVPLRRNER